MSVDHELDFFIGEARESFNEVERRVRAWRGQHRSGEAPWPKLLIAAVEDLQMAEGDLWCVLDAIKAAHPDRTDAVEAAMGRFQEQLKRIRLMDPMDGLGRRRAVEAALKAGYDLLTLGEYDAKTSLHHDHGRTAHPGASE